MRDIALVRLGAPRRLRRVPSVLLWLELAAAASLAGLAAVISPRTSPTGSPAGVLEAVRQAAVGILFGLHAYRFWIYLTPDRGLRDVAGEPGGGSGSPAPGSVFCV